MNLGLITAFGQRHKVWRVRGHSVFEYGKKLPDKFFSFVIMASIQPLEADQTVEEEVGAQRDKHGVKIYTTTELKVADEKKGTRGDIVEYMGEKFEVRKVDRYQLNRVSLMHYRCEAMKLNEDLQIND